LNLSKSLVAALLACGAIAPSFADQYPSKTVTVVVPFPPGGGIDVMIRAVAAELSTKWGKPVIIENKGGAGTLIGAEAVARATPDGYTLLATIDQTLVSNRFLYQKLPYDADKSFLPITLMAESDHMILANPAVPAKDLRELVALAKREKGKLNFGSFGDGSQPVLVYGMLNHREGLDITHIPYRGVAPLMTATVAGEVQLATASASVAGEMIKAKRLKPLATAGKKRSPQFPDVPTTAEQGYPYLRSSVWYGLFAPTGTPPEIVKKINADVTEILKKPAFAEKHGTSKGLQVAASGSKEFSDRIREDVASTGEMVRAANIKPQ
jgi:tripartite-type tricarboxylate transporter receptor subunit TctC